MLQFTHSNVVPCVRNMLDTLSLKEGCAPKEDFRKSKGSQWITESQYDFLTKFI